VAGTLVVRDGRRALEDARGVDAVPLVGPEFHGIPPALLLGVRLLVDPRRELLEGVREARRDELILAIRGARKDLGALSDAELWAWLEKGLGG
jgi:hypothetical protein